ncbi:protein CANDIDATE G-PROTEIN COUPLED RECEPTOR 2-like isoform X2 [Prosopis cineraria]|uniref:protein CANDIDATE G-PROTEIN COUPLED RECEPTOR 2-like isoform X2 n=1 Tax=Prosopis cineraria TaxID=364024 RepID=UPI00241014F5|nr:protein CANDIDATE G-PROTEIN COUPLED RECEPTOR 2-like isoform X2 [Prosopis cineraria]
MSRSLLQAVQASLSLPPTPSLASNTSDRRLRSFISLSNCNGFWYDAFLVVPSVLFVLYLAVHAKKNLKKLCNGGSYVMKSCYALLWAATLLNIAWCFFQAWQCSPGKDVTWNLLSLLTASGILCLEISMMAFLLKDNYMNGIETLAHTFLVSGIIVIVDTLLKAIYVFGFGVPLFSRDVGSSHKIKWGLLIIHKLLLAAAYGFILFVHFSKWREKLPRSTTYHSHDPSILLSLSLSNHSLQATPSVF